MFHSTQLNPHKEDNLWVVLFVRWLIRGLVYVPDFTVL